MLGKRVAVIDRRGHIGGNSYSEIHVDTGIEIHKYGTHVFHTPNKTVWDYLGSFTAFTSYQHKVFTSSNGKVFPLPINLATICQFFGRRMSPDEARALVQEEAAELGGKEPTNLEEKAISLMGRSLYEAFIRGYTQKQWQTSSLSLPASIIARLPVRYTLDNRYFNDPYEGLPIDGYTTVFKRMLAHELIDVRLGTDYFAVRDVIPANKLVIFTGPIDRFFGYRVGNLKWRTIDLEFETVSVGDFQGTAVMNYADASVPFTRIHEYRHLYPERTYREDCTVIAREYSRLAGSQDEPYYPVDTAQDQRMYIAYREMGKTASNVIFGGRLGTYRYLDMHQAIGAALKVFEREITPRLSGQ